MNWTDNHCHLHDERILGGPAAAVAAAHAAGVTTMITVGCDADTSRAAIAVAEEFDVARRSTTAYTESSEKTRIPARDPFQ